MNQHTIKAKAEMLIRKPVAEVFAAFINPEITSKFWFTKGSGRLQKGAHIQWDWEMFGVSAQVDVKDVVQNQRIFIEWDDKATVEWLFTARTENETFVTVINAGFTGTDEEIIAKALDATEGFTLVLCGAKAYLEHNIRLNLTADRFPDAVVEQ
jgi:uncharacterized protein YndB with AHSA1/START domain